MASVISAFLDDQTMSTLFSELADQNRSLPSITGVPTRRLSQTTLDNALSGWQAAIVSSGQQPPAPLTNDNAAPAEQTSEAPPT